MFARANLLLPWCRTLGHRFFLRFGLHCATHQIRIILVSCVVITSLFYPALAIYSSSQPKSLSIIDTFISPSTAPHFHAQKDLVNIWSCHNTLRIHDDAVSRAKCGVGRALRVERILIQSPLTEDDSALSHQILLSTLNLENQLEEHISSGENPCLKRPDGKCFVISPLLFWNYDKETLLSDIDILDTLSPSRNVSVGGIVITPPMTLAGRGSNEPHVAGSKFDFAMFLALTYFFPESDCLGTSEHTLWLQSVHRVLAQSSELTVQIEEPSIIALEYDPNLSKGERWSALSAFLYLAYIGFFAYVAWSVGKMDAVHSRLGVTFTALVEIAVSTITSLSVCALVGFKVTMVPWELLPIVIVFVGAENMFNLVDAVGKTSVTLSVKQRIAEGLSRAGTSNTLKVVCYNAILGVIAVFSVGAVRQFCVFAIVVLVAHWFLAHTFFMAVLSIDIQRLELHELLRHESSTLAPAISQNSGEGVTKQPRSPWQDIISTIQNLLKGRATTNISLLMLLAITATLYYTTYSVSTSSHDETSNAFSVEASSLAGSRLTEPGLHKKPAAWHIWKTFNPTQAPLLHLRIELPTIVTFRPDAASIDRIKQQKLDRPRFSMRTIRLFFWLLKIMVLPIAATTSALWGLLLYLLKNAELLEAQRNRAEPDAPKQHDDKILETKISFSTLPRTFTSDVELIGASKDGNVVVCVGLQNEIIRWQVDTLSHVSIDPTDALLCRASTASTLPILTSVAVDKHGRYCAVGTDAGVIAVWAFQDEGYHALPLLSLENMSGDVTALQFSTVPSQTPEKDTDIVLLATYQNRIATKWCLGDIPTVTHFTPSHQALVVKCLLLRVHPLDRFVIAFCLNNGALELLDIQDTDPLVLPDYHIQAGSPTDTVLKAYICRAELGGSNRLVLAVATEVGLVSLWDGLTGECIVVFEEAYGRINRLRVTPVQCETCHFCGQLPLESLSIAFSVDHIIQFFQLYLNDQTRRCSCSHHQLGHIPSRDSPGHRSRSNSTTSQAGSSSPSIPKARLATAFETSAFPVSGHGVHSRRASEKDTGRRSSEALIVPFISEEHMGGTLDRSNSRKLAQSSSFWRSALVLRVTDVTCERGGWDVAGKKLVGLRRKPRIQGHTLGGTANRINSPSSDGLTTATLERWELWTFDPSASRLQSSLLAALIKEPENSDHSSPHSPPPPSKERIPRLPFTRVSPFLAAPSHTLAGFGNTVGVFSFAI